MPTKTKRINDPFYQGGISALEFFEIELVRNRDQIEADPQPTVDVVIDLVRRLLDEMIRQAK